VIKRLPLEKILIRHIVIGFNGARETKQREPRSKAQAEALATKLREQAVAEDADFAALAREYSDGPAAAKGGLFPPVARGELGSPRVEQYAFALAPGRVSDVIDTDFGYHIVKRIR
jgi:parvulin-like peptidyl-prolyl isomerase